VRMARYDHPPHTSSSVEAHDEDIDAYGSSVCRRSFTFTSNIIR